MTDFSQELVQNSTRDFDRIKSYNASLVIAVDSILENSNELIPFVKG